MDLAFWLQEFLILEPKLLESLTTEMGLSEVVQVVKNSPTNVADARHVSSIPGLGRSPGGGHGNSLQYSCLEKPMDGGAWWATVLGSPGVRCDWSYLACTHYKRNLSYPTSSGFLSHYALCSRTWIEKSVIWNLKSVIPSNLLWQRKYPFS